jgi:hypothetical protein
VTLRELRKRLQQTQQSTEDPGLEQLVARIRNKPFYNWFERSHKPKYIDNDCSTKNCCFNHIIGLPEKKGKRYALFDYENQVIRALTESDFINTRPATEEDESWFEEQRKVLEQNSIANKESSIAANEKLLEERRKRLVYPQKVGHLVVLKSAGLGLTTLMLRYIAWNCMKDDNWKNTDVVILTGPRQSLSNDLITRLKQMFIPFGITFDTSVSTLYLNGVRIRAFPSDRLRISVTPQNGNILLDDFNIG